CARMSNLALRVATAVVLLPGVIALVLWRQTWGFGAFILLVTGLALTEYAGIALRGRPGSERAVPIVLGLALAAGVYVRPDLTLVLALGTVMALGLATLLRVGEIETAGPRMGAAAFGIFYLGLLTPTLALIQRDAADGPRWVLTMIA